MSLTRIRRPVCRWITRRVGNDHRANEKANRQHSEAHAPNLPRGLVTNGFHNAGFTGSERRPVRSYSTGGHDFYDRLFSGFQIRFSLDRRTTAKQVALSDASTIV